VVEGREIPEDLVAFVEGGTVSWLATCDAARTPEVARVRGARVEGTRRALTVFIPSEQSGKTFENLRASPRIAVSFCRITDYRAVQIKGEVLSVRPSDDGEREIQARNMSAFADDCVKLGHPRAPLERFTYWPSMAALVRVDELFVMTPGQGAGRAWP
jgi:hypothetical protein